MVKHVASQKNFRRSSTLAVTVTFISKANLPRLLVNITHWQQRESNAYPVAFEGACLSDWRLPQRICVPVVRGDISSEPESSEPSSPTT